MNEPLKTEFEAQDLIGKFSFLGPHSQAEYLNAKLAEIKKQWLEELLRGAPTVGSHDQMHWVTGFAPGAYKNKARLVCIEEIK